MSDAIDRRTFLETVGRAVAAGSLAAGAPALGAAASRPAVERRNEQPTMGYAKLGRTNFMTSRCVFGAGGLYQGKGELRLLELAIERGMNYIDTGRAYKNSEAVISGLMKKHRDKCWIVSKAGHIGWPDMTISKGEDKKAAKLYTDQLDASLKALQVDTIDCYMVQGVEHDWIVTMESLYEAFAKARQAGKVRYYGLSTHTSVPKVCELAAKTGWYDVIMLAVNPNSLASLTPAIRTIREAGIGVVSMKTSGPIRSNPRVYDDVHRAEFGGANLSPYQRAYAYLLAKGGVDAFIAHMPNREILEEDVAVTTLKLTRAELGRLEVQALADTRGACRHCGDCNRACPEGVNVADMLRYHAYIHNYGQRETARALYDALGRDKASLCTACGACRLACPESIDLAGVISGLKVELA